MADAGAEAAGSRPIPAATVVLGRDSADGLEVLMLRRTTRASFAADAWVFPGGRVDPADTGSGDPEGLPAARRAAVRETEEEAGLVLDPDSLRPVSRWTPNPQLPKRFGTWMFFGPAPAGAQVRVDGGEIVDHRWIRPADALRAQDRGELLLLPPTWVTLNLLAPEPDCEAALARIGEIEPEHFNSRMGTVEGVPVVMWAGDAGYESDDALALGARHRLIMKPGAWRYDRTP